VHRPRTPPREPGGLRLADLDRAGGGPEHEAHVRRREPIGRQAGILHGLPGGRHRQPAEATGLAAGRPFRREPANGGRNSDRVSRGVEPVERRDARFGVDQRLPEAVDAYARRRHHPETRDDDPASERPLGVRRGLRLAAEKNGNLTISLRFHRAPVVLHDTATGMPGMSHRRCDPAGPPGAPAL